MVDQIKQILAQHGLDHLGVQVGRCKNGILIHVLDSGTPIFTQGLQLYVPTGAPSVATVAAVIPGAIICDGDLIFVED